MYFPIVTNPRRISSDKQLKKAKTAKVAGDFPSFAEVIASPGTYQPRYYFKQRIDLRSICCLAILICIIVREMELNSRFSHYRVITGQQDRLF